MKRTLGTLILAFSYSLSATGPIKKNNCLDPLYGEIEKGVAGPLDTIISKINSKTEKGLLKSKSSLVKLLQTMPELKYVYFGIKEEFVVDLIRYAKKSKKKFDRSAFNKMIASSPFKYSEFVELLNHNPNRLRTRKLTERFQDIKIETALHNRKQVITLLKKEFENVEGIDHLNKTIKLVSEITQYDPDLPLRISKEVNLAASIIKLLPLKEKEVSLILNTLSRLEKKLMSADNFSSLDSIGNSIQLLLKKKKWHQLHGDIDLHYLQSPSMKTAIDYLGLKEEILDKRIIVRMEKGINPRYRRQVETVIFDIDNFLEKSSLILPDKIIIKSEIVCGTPCAFADGVHLNLGPNILFDGVPKKHTLSKVDSKAIAAHEYGHLIFTVNMAKINKEVARFVNNVKEELKRWEGRSNKDYYEIQEGLKNSDSLILHNWTRSHEVFADLIAVLHLNDRSAVKKAIRKGTGSSDGAEYRDFNHLPLNELELKAWDNTSDHDAYAPVRWFIGHHILKDPILMANPAKMANDVFETLSEFLNKLIQNGNFNRKYDSVSSQNREIINMLKVKFNILE